MGTAESHAAPIKRAPGPLQSPRLRFPPHLHARNGPGRRHKGGELGWLARHRGMDKALSLRRHRQQRSAGETQNSSIKSVALLPSYLEVGLNGRWQDGTQIQLRSASLGKYLCAENGGGSVLVANRASPSGWETFKVSDLSRY